MSAFDGASDSAPIAIYNRPQRGNRMAPLSNLATRDVETLVHPYTNLAGFRDAGPLILERGRGVHVYDTDGKAYIEGMAGLWCTALGYGNEELVEAAAVQMRKLSFASVHRQEPRSRHRACREAQRDRAGADLQGVLLRLGLGSERQPDQARLVSQQRARPAEEEKSGEPRKGLSRRHHRGRLADRTAGEPPRLRSTVAGLSAYGLPASLSVRGSRRERGGVRHALGRRARSADRQGGPRHGRGLHRRAGDGCGGRDRAAAQLFREG